MSWAIGLLRIYLWRRNAGTPSLIRPTPDMDNEVRAPLREQLKEKCQKFRILIIGRANAGKSTILKRICDTTEEPEILDSKGNKVMG
jgi:GTP-binding protein EngB required for normal cell division